MRHFHVKRNILWKPTINVDKAGYLVLGLLNKKGLTVIKLWSLIPDDKRDKHLSSPDSNNAPVIDLLSFGYAKVLGKGRLPKVPFVLRTRYITTEAENNVKKVGGIVQLVT